MPNGEKVASPVAAFDAAVGALFAAVVDYAVLNSSKRFATGLMDFDESTPKIYALAQCRPDISPAECRICLDQLVSVTPKHFSGRRGGRILGVRCNYRFELYPPFSGTPVLHLQALTSAVAPSPNGEGPTVSRDGGELQSSTKSTQFS
jgi:hypothetical protein